MIYFPFQTALILQQRFIVTNYYKKKNSTATQTDGSFLRKGMFKENIQNTATECDVFITKYLTRKAFKQYLYKSTVTHIM